MRLVVDASIAIKWVVQEDDTTQALRLLRRNRLVAPELMLAECANILWKKVQRRNMTADAGAVAARLLERSEIELVPMRALVEAATRLAVELNHPAYDCTYLVLAEANRCRFATADDRLVRKLHQAEPERFGEMVLSLADAASV